jgi:hypothetical protein
MQIHHLALDGPPNWLVPELADVAMVHVTEGLDAVSASVNEAQRGLLPAHGTIVVAQSTALDLTRAPDSKSILCIQLQELPGRICGDALREIPAPPDSRWTLDVRELYADRTIARLERLIPNLRGTILGRKVLSPADLEGLNINLEGGIRIPVPAISISSFCGAPFRDREITLAIHGAISHRRCDTSRSGTGWNFRVSGRGGRLVDDRFIRGSQAAAPQLERLSVRAIPLARRDFVGLAPSGLFEKSFTSVDSGSIMG